jgi:transposase
MLLPPDLHEWVTDNHLVKFVVEAVAATDKKDASLNQRGTGSEQYPPEMMLGLLIYCYATGLFSSRKIERASYDSVAVRYVCANTHPDHDTIAKFRRENGALIRRCFVQVLELAREMGVLKVGTISLDGTKIKASAAKRKTMTEEQLAVELERIEREVQDRLAAAETSDVEPEADGLQLPDALGSLKARRQRLAEARERLAERRVAGDGKRSSGRTPVINTTDQDSGLMPTRQGPFIQGYNAQAVSTTPEGGGLIVGTHVSQASNDRQELAVAIEELAPELGLPEIILADSGYDNSKQIAEIEKQTGAMVLCPPQEPPARLTVAKPTRYRQEHPRRHAEVRRTIMRERLASPDNKARYQQRNMSEANFALIKQGLGFTRFQLRGHEKVNVEWALVCLAANCRKLSRLN